MARGFGTLAKWLGGDGSLSETPGVVEKPSWRAGMGQETLLEGREESGVTSGEHEGVGWAGTGWEILPEGRDGSRGPSRESGGIGRAGRIW